jgi:hypothetical protein
VRPPYTADRNTAGRQYRRFLSATLGAKTLLFLCLGNRRPRNTPPLFSSCTGRRYIAALLYTQLSHLPGDDVGVCAGVRLQTVGVRQYVCVAHGAVERRHAHPRRRQHAP